MRYLPTLILLLLMTTPATAQSGGDRPVGEKFATRSPVLAQNGIAATSHPLASQVAIDILKQGGSAVDAAIAASAALGLMEPVSCGIGGDLFAIVWDPVSRRLHGLNASGRAPSGLSFDQMQSQLDGRLLSEAAGAVTVSVPGAVDGWFELHERFGELPMTDVLAPAIAYARDGFPVTQVIAAGWQANIERFEAHVDEIEELDNLRKTFLIDGRAPREGDVFRNPDLARTYTIIAERGRDAFYRGEIADAIDAYMRRIGGFIRKEDLAAHTSTWVEPISTTYRGYEVHELPPNGQGLAALQMLNILEGFDLAAMGHNSTDYLHVHAEAKKLAFEDRARYYADPDFYDAPVDLLLSKEYAARRRAMMRMDKSLLQLSVFDEGALEEGDTIYLTVADASGMMVSLIQSNYSGMGSGLVPDGLGFGLQDRGALFAMDPEHPNVYAPGKRPFHTIIPAFVTKDGEPFLSVGVMGGAMQPQGHAQIIANIVDFGMNVQEAGDAARYRHVGSSQPTGEVMTDGGTLTLEPAIGADVVDSLRARGHVVEYGRGSAFGGYQAILWDAKRGVYHGASEMRKDGQAVGY